MFPQQSSISVNSRINSSIQGRNEPSSPLPSWLGNVQSPMQYEDEKANSFKSQPAIPVDGFVDKNIDSRYYSTSDITDTRLIDNWQHKSLDAPNQRNLDLDALNQQNLNMPNQQNIDTGGRLSSGNSYYQRFDYGHCRQSPTIFDNTTDQPFPEEANSGLQRKEYLTDNSAISDDELFQLFEDGLDVMVQTNEGIQCFMDFDPRLKSFFLPIFKDRDLDAVIRDFGQGEERVAIKKLEEMVLLTKNKIQHLCTEIAETISIRSRKEVKQKSRHFAKPVRLLNNHENPVDQKDDDLNRSSEFRQSSLPAICDDPSSDTLMPKYLRPPPIDGLLPTLDLRDFPPPLVPPPPIGMFPGPLCPFGVPFLPLPHLGNMVPPILATATQGNPMLPLPVIQPILEVPTKTPQSMLAASTALLPKEKPRLVKPAVKKAQKTKYPSCLRSIPLLSTSQTKTQSSNNSVDQTKNMDVKVKSHKRMAASTALLPKEKPCLVEPTVKKAQKTKYPSCLRSISLLSTSQTKTQSSNNSVNQTKNMDVKVKPHKRMAASTTLLPKAKPSPLEPAAKKAKTTQIPSLLDLMTPSSKISNMNKKNQSDISQMEKNISPITNKAEKAKNESCLSHTANTNNQTSDNSLNKINNKEIAKTSKTEGSQQRIFQKAKVAAIVKYLNTAKKITTSRDLFLENCFNEIGHQWLQISYIVTPQADFFWGSLSIGGVFITRQKVQNKNLLWKTVFTRAYNVLRLIPVDEIIELGDPSADGEPVLKEEKFELILAVKKIKIFLDKEKIGYSQPELKLNILNKSTKKSLRLVSVNKKLTSPKTKFCIMGKVMLGNCQISLEFAPTFELATEKAVDSAIQRLKSLSPEEIAYENGLKTDTI